MLPGVLYFDILMYLYRSWAVSLLCGNGESGQEHNSSFALFPCLISLTVSSVRRCTFLFCHQIHFNWVQYPRKQLKPCIQSSHSQVSDCGSCCARKRLLNSTSAFIIFIIIIIFVIIIIVIIIIIITMTKFSNLISYQLP